MKIIKIDSCCKCPNKSSNNRCFLLSIKSDRVRVIRNDDIVHPDCPLEDYNDPNNPGHDVKEYYKECECEPFQSCNKCKQ